MLHSTKWVLLPVQQPSKQQVMMPLFVLGGKDFSMQSLLAMRMMNPVLTMRILMNDDDDDGEDWMRLLQLVPVHN